ncbi:MAG TPA: phosphoglycerate dehydrogenase [Chitinivibrionales bacterium]|nr:phosphoglycerate dehydrogenase [Chitinivibrionales bacterium]
MFKIQTLNKISPKGLELFPREEYEIASELMNPDAVLVRSADMHEMQMADCIKAIARAGAGVNNIPIDKCSQKGIVVMNTPGANANSVKELVIAGLLLCSRKLVDGIIWAKGLAGKGDEVPKLIEKGKSNFEGPEIKGKRLGVIGLGAIGVKVANDAVSLGMEVTGYDPIISVEAAWELSHNVKRSLSLDGLVAKSDYITLHVPLNDKTKGMLNKEKFALMKKGVRILNFARGGLVKNEDLKEALKAGTVAAYVTDFPDQDLVALEGVIPIPHLGASTPEAEDNCAIMAVNQTKNFLEYGNIKNAVNFPDCEMEPSGKTRILVGNRNVPNMVGQITSLLAAEKINIADMLNKSKGDLAYNIIDIDNVISESALKKLKAIEGIIMVSVLEKK